MPTTDPTADAIAEAMRKNDAHKAEQTRREEVAQELLKGMSEDKRDTVKTAAGYCGVSVTDFLNNAREDELKKL